jgi:hypothetical protein
MQAVDLLADYDEVRVAVSARSEPTQRAIHSIEPDPDVPWLTNPSTLSTDGGGACVHPQMGHLVNDCTDDLLGLDCIVSILRIPEDHRNLCAYEAAHARVAHVSYAVAVAPAAETQLTDSFVQVLPCKAGVGCRDKAPRS